MQYQPRRSGLLAVVLFWCCVGGAKTVSATSRGRGLLACDNQQCKTISQGFKGTVSFDLGCGGATDLKKVTIVDSSSSPNCDLEDWMSYDGPGRIEIDTKCLDAGFYLMEVEFDDAEFLLDLYVYQGAWTPTNLCIYAKSAADDDWDGDLCTCT